MPSVEAELYELSMPGRLLGKEVLDNRARRIGIVRSIRIALNPTRSELIVKGAEVEFPVDFSKVDDRQRLRGRAVDVSRNRSA